MTVTLNLRSVLELTDEQFYQLCQVNRDLRLERTAKGELIIMPPTGGEAGNRNIKIAFQLEAWSSQNALGIAFDSSTGFNRCLMVQSDRLLPLGCVVNGGML
jgi:Uma2 family endonuclease